MRTIYIINEKKLGNNVILASKLAKDANCQPVRTSAAEQLIAVPHRNPALNTVNASPSILRTEGCISAYIGTICTGCSLCTSLTCSCGKNLLSVWVAV